MNQLVCDFQVPIFIALWVLGWWAAAFLIGVATTKLRK